MVSSVVGTIPHFTTTPDTIPAQRQRSPLTGFGSPAFVIDCIRHSTFVIRH
jgi:hypothetical protein